jgi:8-oxo-dGTP pyrophosphatase MutT (NUDIX family)/inorganic pyrophosphatase
VTDFEHCESLFVPADVCNGHAKEALTRAELDAAAALVAPDPSEAQKEVGNYAKGHVSWQGLGLTIETAKGQYRRGVGKDGAPWRTLMKDHYGYVKRTKSEADGDHVDVFLCGDAPDAPEREGRLRVPGDANLRSEVVFVVNQGDPATDTFDEHKVVLGVVSEEAARAVYLRNYEPGWRGLRSVTPMTVDQFKWWLANADTSKEIRDGFWAAAANRKKAADEGGLPYRDRAEMYALKDGKLFGGLYPHGGFGVFGGGIDDGEDAAAAAAREFQEETGWTVTNPRPLPFEPNVLDWKPPFDDPKLAERAKQYRGSRTRYYAGDLGEQIPHAKVDELGRSGVGLYSLDDALAKSVQQGLGPTLTEANARRQAVIQYLRAHQSAKAAGCPEGECCPHCHAQLERGDNGDCNRCGKPWPAPNPDLAARS